MFRGKIAQFVFNKRMSVDVKDNIVAANYGAGNLHVVELQSVNDGANIGRNVTLHMIFPMGSNISVSRLWYYRSLELSSKIQSE